MRTPLFMLGAAVLFWGWQSEHVWLALAVALALEISHIERLHWQFSTLALTRIANGCTLLFVAANAYFIASSDVTQGVLTTVKSIPLIDLPLFLAIAYSGLPRVPLSIISSFARKHAKTDPAGGIVVDLGLVYVTMWLLAAGVSNQPGPGFYAGILAMGGWMLWGIRPHERSPWIWFGLMVAVAASGALVNQGLYRLQGALEQGMMNLLSGDGDEDPLSTKTDLGHIGQLKLSGTVAMQVQTGRPLSAPLLLKTASYNTYAAPSWLLLGNNGFHAVARLPTAHAVQATWLLTGTAATPATPVTPVTSATPSPTDMQIEIATSALRASTVLALPPGANTLESPQFIRLERNPLGTVQATLEKGFYTYGANYSAPRPMSMPAPAPDPASPQDLTLPRNERALFQQLAQRLQLPGKPAPQILSGIKSYFAANYSYSTTRQGNAIGNSAMADFLTREHRGHCEHFATASVLLLRAAGIPARYAVGYSVQEPSRFGSGYVVRQRHAHAWAEAYVDGVWQDFDTTPPAWPRLEQSSASFWEPLVDGSAWLMFNLRQWHFSRNAFLLLALVIALIVALRPTLAARRKARQLKAQKQVKDTPLDKARISTEEESAFSDIKTLLAAHGMTRPAHEPLSHWQTRIAPRLGDDASQALAHIIRLHYRCRFGPTPVPPEERQRLRDASLDWITRFGGGLAK